jgi:site-specific recombinase XerD
MAIFKRKSTGTTIGKWTIQIADHRGILRRFAGFTDQNASSELERNVRKLISIRQAGGSLLDAESNRFIESAPARVRNNLAKWGIIDGERAARGKPLEAHVEDWRLALEAKGNTDQHVIESIAKVATIANDCGWRTLSDIAATDMDHWRNDAKTAGKAAQTINHYLTVAKTFCNWLMRERRIPENPLAYLSKLNAKADRRVERHPYTVEELGLLLMAAEAGPVVHGMTGPDRALLYRTATNTGFRYNELHSLERASFEFRADPATVTIEAANAKNGQEDTLPLRPELAADLRRRMALFLPNARAFPGMWRERGADMIRVDLEAAGILKRDAKGKLIRTRK